MRWIPWPLRQPATESDEAARRARIKRIVGAAGVVLAAGAAAAWLSRDGAAKIPDLHGPPILPSGARATMVREHPRNQACGPKLSERKSIIVAAHSRQLGPKAA